MVDAEEEGEGFPEQRLRFSSSFWRSGWLGWPFECLTAQRVSEWVVWWLDGEWTTQRCTLGDCKISHFRELDVYWDTSTLPHTSTHIHTHTDSHTCPVIYCLNLRMCIYACIRLYVRNLWTIYVSLRVLRWHMYVYTYVYVFLGLALRKFGILYISSRCHCLSAMYKISKFCLDINLPASTRRYTANRTCISICVCIYLNSIELMVGFNIFWLLYI